MIVLYCDHCGKKITEKRENIFDDSDIYAIEASSITPHHLEIRQWVGTKFVICKPCLLLVVEEWLIAEKDKQK